MKWLTTLRKARPPFGFRPRGTESIVLDDLLKPSGEKKWVTPRAVSLASPTE